MTSSGDIRGQRAGTAPGRGHPDIVDSQGLGMQESVLMEDSAVQGQGQPLRLHPGEGWADRAACRLPTDSVDPDLQRM